MNAYAVVLFLWAQYLLTSSSGDKKDAQVKLYLRDTTEDIHNFKDSFHKGLRKENDLVIINGIADDRYHYDKTCFTDDCIGTLLLHYSNLIDQLMMLEVPQDKLVEMLRQSTMIMARLNPLVFDSVNKRMEAAIFLRSSDETEWASDHKLFMQHLKNQFQDVWCMHAQPRLPRGQNMFEIVTLFLQFAFEEIVHERIEQSVMIIENTAFGQSGIIRDEIVQMLINGKDDFTHIELISEGRKFFDLCKPQNEDIDTNALYFASVDFKQSLNLFNSITSDLIIAKSIYQWTQNHHLNIDWINCCLFIFVLFASRNYEYVEELRIC